MNGRNIITIGRTSEKRRRSVAATTRRLACTIGPLTFLAPSSQPTSD